MKRFKYVGPFDEVEIPAVGAVVGHGETVEIEDPDLSASLVEQSDSWEHLPNPTRSKAAKKAASSDNEDVKES